MQKFGTRILVHEPHRLVMAIDFPRIRWLGVLFFGMIGFADVAFGLTGMTLNPSFSIARYVEHLYESLFMGVIAGLFLTEMYVLAEKSGRIEIDEEQRVVRISVQHYKHRKDDGVKSYPYGDIARIKQYKDKRGKELRATIELTSTRDAPPLHIDRDFCRALAKCVADTIVFWKRLFSGIPVEVEVIGGKKERVSRVDQQFANS